VDDKLVVSEVSRFPLRRHKWQMRYINPRIFIYNWNQKQILRTIIAPKAFFDNYEYSFLSNSYHYNGARGITANDQYIFIALQNTIVVFDITLNRAVRYVHNKLFNGIHEIEWHQGKLYVTCAVTDLIMVLNEGGEVLNIFYLGNNHFLTSNFKLTPRVLDNGLDYRLMHKCNRLYHVNNVQVIDENIYANLNKQGGFVQIYPEEKIIIQDPNLIGSHNSQFDPRGKFILINNTSEYSINVYNDRGDFIRTIDFRRFSLPIDFSEKKTFNSNHLIKAGWLRGMAFSNNDPDIVYVGLSPVTICSVNYMSGELLDFVQFRKNIWISIHSICNLPKQ
jgi:glutamine cyclotransferase